MPDILGLQQSIPSEINTFFIKTCGKAPLAKLEKNTLVYRAEKAPVSLSTDSHGGCHIDIEEQVSPQQLEKIRTAIEALSDSFKKKRSFDSIWIDLALPANAQSLGLVSPPSFRIGEKGQCDLIYDVQKKKLRLWQWINDQKECAIPAGPTYKMGATALLLDRIAKKALLVVNARRSDAWNLPGGSYDPFLDKAPSATALREAQEEGGFTLDGLERSEPILVGQMQFPLNQFAPSLNQTWAYFIDGASTKELHPPKEEILQAEWVSFEEIKASQGKWKGLKLGAEIKASLSAALQGLGFERIVEEQRMIVHAPRLPARFDSIASLQELEKRAEILGKDDWGLLVLDLDQTLIQAKPGLGDHHCSRFLHRHHQAHGIDEHIHYKWSVEVKRQARYEACEKAQEVNQILQTFRKRGWTVQILTSRGLDMKEMTGRHLKEAGLDVSLADVIFKEPRPNASGKLLSKDEGLEQWMRSQPEWGSKRARIVFIDDVEKYCGEIARLSKRLRQTQVTCLQYTGCLARPELSEEERELYAVQLHALQCGRPLLATYTETDLAKALQGLNMRTTDPEELYSAMMRMILQKRS